MTRKHPYAALVIVIVLLIAGTTMPGTLKAEIERQLWSQWNWSASAHFVLFATMTMIPAYGNRPWWPLHAIALACALAVLTESLQRLVPGRHPLVRDCLIDLAGTATGLLAATCWRRRTQRPSTNIPR